MDYVTITRLTNVREQLGVLLEEFYFPSGIDENYDLPANDANSPLWQKRLGDAANKLRSLLNDARSFVPDDVIANHLGSLEESLSRFENCTLLGLSQCVTAQSRDIAAGGLRASKFAISSYLDELGSNDKADREATLDDKSIRISGTDNDTKPEWDSDAGKLYFAGKVVRTVARRAKNLCCVLDTFHEDGWPIRIDDPMTGGANSERLNKAVKRLNENLSGIRFTADGSGQGIAWAVREQQES